MNGFKFLFGCAMFAIAGQAAAQCTANERLNSASAINTHLSDKTVCGTGVGANAGDQWQEYHQAGVTLTEYAKGPNDPVDPTHAVGSWTTSGSGSNSVVTYSYNDGGSFSFNVHYDGTTTEFCNGNSQVATATLRSGQQGCGF